MNEELLIKMGLDSSAMATGIRGVKAQLENFGDSIKSTFSEVGTQIGAAFGVGGAIITLEKALDRAREIKRVSEELGISPKFVQDLQAVASVSGVSSQQIERMMSAFTKKLQTGEDPEEAFYKWANAIAAIEDPITRVQMAMDAFGRGGQKMISIAGQGADAFKTFGNSFARFSDADIAGLETAKTGMERFFNAITVGAGKALLGFQKLGQIISNIDPKLLIASPGTAISAAMGATMAKDVAGDQKRATDAANVKQAEAREKELSDAEAIYQADWEIDQMWIKILDRQIKTAERIKRQQQEQLNILNSASMRTFFAIQTLQSAQSHQVGFSLEELASRARFSAVNQAMFGGTGQIGPPGSAEAAQVMQLREWSKANALRNTPASIALAGRQADKANEIFDKLSAANPFLIDPLEGLKRSAEKQVKHLEILSERAAGKNGGIVIEPEMGE